VIVKRVKSLLAASVCFFAVGLCPGQTPILNDTPGRAATMAMGQKVTVKVDNATGVLSWYLAAVVPGRSYCAEIGATESPLIAEQHPFVNLSVFRADAVTIVAGDTITVDEPKAVTFARTCWIQPAVGGFFAFLKLEPADGTSFVTLRLVETTLYCPWFFVSGDYNAFSLIRNTTAQTQTATVVWRGLNGSVAGTTTFPISPNGTAIVNARDFVNPALFSNGSVEIAHEGSPQALVGSTTTLSGTTGLGFDAKFEQRKPW
jgi:hypothetical protein